MEPLLSYGTDGFMYEETDRVRAFCTTCGAGYIFDRDWPRDSAETALSWGLDHYRSFHITRGGG